jgi:glycosyltransferase involved in cell wall biosynthesis
MKIVHLAPHCDDTGNGVVNVAVDLACLQAETGHEVIFASKGGAFETLLRSYGVTHYKFPDQSFRSLPSSLVKMRRLLKTFQPDIVHAHMIPGALLAFLMRFRLSFSLITTAHNGPLFRTMLMAVGDLVISVSEGAARGMVRRGFPRRKLRVVKNGPLNSPRRNASVDRWMEQEMRHPAVVTVAGLFSYKGISDLIDAFSFILIDAFSFIAPLVPAAHLYIVGDGDERAEFENEAARKGCADRIIFCGLVQNPRTYLQSCDVFVLPSRREAFGLVLAEAREAGCAIIASRVGGIPEVLDDGLAGMLVPPRSPRLLAEGILELLRDDQQRALWRSKASKNLRWLDAHRVAAETIDVYDESLARR